MSLKYFWFMNIMSQLKIKLFLNYNYKFIFKTGLGIYIGTDVRA